MFFVKSHLIFFLIIIFSSAGYLNAQTPDLTEIIATKYCNELSQNDTATKANFQDILPKLDEKIIFGESTFLSLIVKEVNEKKITYGDFYTGVYNTFSRSCVKYQALQGVDTSVHLKDGNYFTGSFCNCFNEETGGKIESGDLTNVLKTCNEKLGNERSYKKKVKKELRKNKISEKQFSEQITARFVTGCDLIINHLFNRQAKFMELSTILLIKKSRAKHGKD